MVRFKFSTLGSMREAAKRLNPWLNSPSISGEVMHDQSSYELVCLHEAGHAQAAIHAGATVVEIEMYKEEQDFAARTRVQRNSVQAAQIALGGFAAECLLFWAGRLRNLGGTATTQAQFVLRAMNHARLDRLSFAANAHGCMLDDARHIPDAIDAQFLLSAQELAKHHLSLETIERVAVALRNRRKLNAAQILAAYNG